MPPDPVLVVGGAGYVGSAVARRLHRDGVPVVVYDDLSTGHAGAVPGIPFESGDAGDADRIADVVRRRRIGGGMHFAARSLVSESVRDPALYWRENVEKGWRLFEGLVRAGVRRILFSSSAAVYGVPETVPIPEEAAIAPVNPYGRTKGVLEWMLSDLARTGGVGGVALRYFNAAGADPDGPHGEDHAEETHLIPNLLAAVREGRPVPIYGTDYDTPDGTCIRDYVHLLDLAEAHVRAWDRTGRSGFAVYNLGRGEGGSVRQVVAVAERVTGRKATLREEPRREGDPPVLVASPERARRELGWTATRDLDRIVADAWTWHRDRPEGYG